MSVPTTPELCVLKALWRQQPLSAREIHQAVEDELAWSFSSTRKTIERMLEKGMVSQHARHGVQVYDAVLEKVSTLAAYAHDFGRRVMEMDTPLPVNMFVGSKLVDARELEQLEQMLSDWPDEDGPGNLRVSYVLPSRDLQVRDAGVLWPAPGAPLAEAVAAASRHRLVWVDLALP